jgi:hypothetical protein
MRLRLVLEGGGICGLYQVGVLNEVRRRETAGEFSIDAISGASIGSYLAFAYFNGSLDEAVETVAMGRRCLRERQYGSTAFFDAVKEQILGCSDEVFDQVKEGTLYSTRTHISRACTVIDTAYGTREDLADALLCSMHIPYVTGTSWYRISDDGHRYTDGVFPSVFRDRQGEDYRTMYVASTAFICPQHTLGGWSTAADRVRQGEEDARVFFRSGRTSRYCSYVDQWGIVDFAALRAKQSLAWLVRTGIFLLTSLIAGVLVPLKILVSTLLDDVMLHMAFSDFGSGSLSHDIVVAVVGTVTMMWTVIVETARELSTNTHRCSSEFH